MKQKQNDNILGLVLVLFLGLGLFLVLFLVSGLVLVLFLVLVLVSGLILVLFLGLVLSVLDTAYDKYAPLLIVFFIIGAVIGGVIGYQQTQINSLQANTITTTTIPPSTYQGIVQGIYTNNPSSITFTTGQTWVGNISRVSNLTIGSICTLIQYQQSQGFTNGTCKVNP